MPRRLAATLAAAVLCLAGAGAVPVTASARAAARPSLAAFGSCRALLGYARTNAARAGGVGVPLLAAAGTPTPIARPAPVPVGVVTPTVSDGTATPSPAAAAQPDHSDTNVQEAGIDEPDVVKTDGRRIVAIVDGRLDVIDATGDVPRLTGSLALPDAGDDQLLLRGDRVLVLTSRVAGGVVPVDVAAPRLVALPVATTTVLTEVDISDPAAPRIARTMTLDGRYVDARMTGGTVRVVVSSTPSPVAVPLARASLRTFVPATTIRSRISGRTFRRGVVPCDDVRRPDAFSGLDLLSVLTIDLDRGLYSVDRDAILAGAQAVYGSADSLYVASRPWVPGLRDTGDVPGGAVTEIHRFDASQPGRTSYAASGTVPGFVVDQFSLSEYAGTLRVASTDEPTWLPEGGPSSAPSSSVTVLRQHGDQLTTVGRVGGLGTGQRLYAVRFDGPAAYVVTFRQIDPLSTIDLSDPSAPRVAGELELSGYSSYLHPLGGGLLLGVGQDANDQGRVQGTQVSLFDVSDLAHPKRLAHVVFGSGSSQAEFDHHAFLWWAPTGLAVLPLATYGDAAATFVGAVGLHVARGGVSEVGRIVHQGDQGPAPISRSLVIGDRVYTLSWLGVKASRLDTLAPLSFLAL